MRKNRSQADLLSRLQKEAVDVVNEDLIFSLVLDGLIPDDDVIDELQIPHYELHLNSKGRGKGVATYYKKALFKHASDVKGDNMQLSKFT